jgi:aryl-alcohol dehydrogenase-like predicted oxidoreductase
MNLPGYEWLKEKWSTDAGRAQLEQVRQLARLSNEIGLSITHLALLWCLANKNVSTVILGASRASQLQDNLAALSHKDKMTSAVLERIDSIVGNKPEAPRRF